MSDRNVRRGIRAWMLFDWANQPFQTLIVTFIFAPYFAARVVGDPVAGQAIWGWTVAAGGVAVALSAPLLGAIADRTGARKPWIAAFSVPYVLGCFGLWLAVPDAAPLWPVLIFFVAAYVGSEFTLVFTNAMLPDLGPRSETGRISGSGWALGYLGGLAALLFVLAFLVPAGSGTETLLGRPPALGLDDAAGEPARAVGPLSGFWFLVFATPFFVFTPDAERRKAAHGLVRSSAHDLRATIASLPRHRSLLFYFLASMLYRDALAALFAFGGIYAAGVLGWGLFDLGLFGIVAAGTGALGAFAGGRADRTFGPRPVIVTSIIALVAVCLVTLLTTRQSVLFIPVAEGSALPDAIFYAAGGCLGAAAGALQAASRTLMILQASGRMGSAQAFGLYALSGKATAFIGPALIALATGVTGSQQLGISPVIFLFLAGLWLLYKVDGVRIEKKEREQA